MGRAFDFPSPVKFEAYLRQKRRCACCGEKLDELIDHTHHVIPNQAGRAGDANHAWLASVDNCAILCDDCHYEAHEYGRYRTGAVALPEFFSYSHGKASKTHQEWALDLYRLSRSIWPGRG